jgi:uncharacterized protein (TIGR02444 family)
MMPFRDFSFTVYTAPGVEEECLGLQDGHGVDVNILLFCAYAAAVGQIALSAQDLAEIDQEVAGLRDGVIAPLRTCRRALKQGIARLYPEQILKAQQLRARVKELELAAEYIEQNSLAAWLAASGRRPAGASVAPKENIGLLLSRHRRGDRVPPFPENLARAALSCV